MVHKSSKSSSRSNSSRSASLHSDMDRKVYIPLCFCLISFAVLVYSECAN